MGEECTVWGCLRKVLCSCRGGNLYLCCCVSLCIPVCLCLYSCKFVCVVRLFLCSYLCSCALVCVGQRGICLCVRVCVHAFVCVLNRRWYSGVAGQRLLCACLCVFLGT